MFEKLQADLFQNDAETLTPLSGAFLARMSALPIQTDAGLMEREVGCGQNTEGWFARYDPASSSLRTSQTCLIGGYAEFSATLPRAGMMRNGKLYRRPRWVPDTCANVFSLLPTPTANDGKGAGRKRFLGSPFYRGSKTAEALRTGYNDPIYISPNYSEVLMGFPEGWTDLGESETR